MPHTDSRILLLGALSVGGKATISAGGFQPMHPLPASSSDNHPHLSISPILQVNAGGGNDGQI